MLRRILSRRGNSVAYIYRDDDSQGNALDGRNAYAITFAKGELPPVRGFWSLTLYNEEHFFHANALNRYSLGTKNKSLEYNEDGSLIIYAGAKIAGSGQREQLAAGTERSILALHSRLLGRQGDHRRFVDATGGATGELGGKSGSVGLEVASFTSS